MHRRQVIRTLSGAALAAPLAGTALLTGPAVAGPRGALLTDVSDRRDELEQMLVAMHEAGMPGVLAHVREQGNSYHVAAGLSNVDTGRPARPWMRQRIGGASKSFAATIVLQLVGEGRIDLDRPIGHYLPDVVPGERGQQITIRMLLNHTSGIADFMFVLFATMESIADTAARDFRPIELAQMGLAMPAVAPPGARWSYAHTNYVILGLLIERLSGRPYREVLYRRVLHPLGLHDTYMPHHELGIRGTHLKAYIPRSDDNLDDLVDYTRFNMTWGWVACDLVSTAHDMNRFFRLLLGGRVLEPALLAEMKTTVPFDPIYRDFAGYGLGIYWILRTCGKMWGHNGFVVGQTIYSNHSEDGNEIQITLAENLNFYKEPWWAEGGTHPIDVARTAIQESVWASCLAGTSEAGIAAHAATASTLASAAAPTGGAQIWRPVIRDVMVPR